MSHTTIPLPGAAGQSSTGTPTPGVIVSLRGVSKIYGSGQTRVVALDDVDVDFLQGRFTAIMGPSGSGKSTMLHVLAGLDTATSGGIEIEGTDLTTLSDDELTRLRRDRIGFVFQSFNLVPTLDARANILLPLKLAGRKPDRAWFDQVVTTLGLTERLTHRPSELSGGQQQRVAVARALVMRPAVIVADEPTGNLDSEASREVLDLLRGAVDQLGQTVIMVTHDPASAATADRVLLVRDGRVVADLDHPTTEELGAFGL
jgi:ABC-type antimicrobial peptide transport system, ATPase component